MFARKIPSSSTVGYNGKIARASSKDSCAVCETKILSGKRTAQIAGEMQWIKICDGCLEQFYMRVSGIN